MSITKYLPLTSFAHYLSGQNKNPTDSEITRTLKSFGHAVYAIATLTPALLWCATFHATGEVNPITQRQVILQRVKDAEERKQTEADSYQSAHRKVFSPHGLADTNNDGHLSFSEEFEAYRRMGLESKIVFPKPTREQLDKAIVSYESFGEENKTPKKDESQF